MGAAKPEKKALTNNKPATLAIRSLAIEAETKQKNN
jgi:hypothetical protein